LIGNRDDFSQIVSQTIEFAVNLTELAIIRKFGQDRDTGFGVRNSESGLCFSLTPNTQPLTPDVSHGFIGSLLNCRLSIYDCRL
jgi:hypothetical protein